MQIITHRLEISTVCPLICLSPTFKKQDYAKTISQFGKNSELQLQVNLLSHHLIQQKNGTFQLDNLLNKPFHTFCYYFFYLLQMTKGAIFNINSLNKKKRPFFHFLLHESSIKVPITNDKLKGLCTAMYSKAKKNKKKKG